MKTFLWAAALVAVGLALPGRAAAEGLLPGRICVGANFYIACRPQGGPQLGPWYLYWPLEAHFQPIAPAAYPYWPPTGPQSLPPNFQGPPPLPPGAPLPRSAASKPVVFQQAGYYGPPPAYWYSR